jgi:2,3-dihydroxyphenylpropionate 1,2-dioxygenase
MAVQLICCSHSPLMVTGIEETQGDVQAQFFSELDACAEALRAFDPDLVVVFGPDHFNGFFYEMMPVFCIGTAAEGSKDWRLESGALKVPRELAVACVRHLQAGDFDVAISHAMKVDHGMTIPLYKLTGGLARYDVLPVFINCAADPRPSFRRVRAFGAALGEFLADRDLRVTFVGSGGLSHDPPTPRIDHSKPEATERLVVARTPTQEELDAREDRVVRAARDLVVGKGPCLPPSEQWDRDFLGTFLAAKLEDFDRRTDAEIDRVAGFGAHEVRTWVAAAAAARAMGQVRPELRYYHLVPEWITGMGIVVGQG